MSNVDQMVENVRIARLRLASLRKDLEAAGFVVGEEYLIDPETGKIAGLNLSSTDGVNWEKAKAVFAEMQASGILRDGLCSFGVGSMLMPRGPSRDDAKLAFKLHDFGYRRG